MRRTKLEPTKPKTILERTTPEELAKEMHYMADLHPEWFWAKVMKDGAEMIDVLHRKGQTNASVENRRVATLGLSG